VQSTLIELFPCLAKMKNGLGFKYSFICQGTSTSRLRTCYYQSNHSKVEAIPLSALPKDATSELAGLPSHYLSFMLNVKQESCEYQLFKSFDLTRPGNRIQVCRLRGGRSNHKTTRRLKWDLNCKITPRRRCN